MNGIYLHLLLKEINDLIVGRYIREIYRLDRALQIELEDRVILVSLYPQAPAICLTNRLPGFTKFPYLGDLVQHAKIVGVNQTGFLPVVQIRLEKTVCAEKKFGEITIFLYRDAPNLTIRSPEVQRSLFARLVNRAPKRPIIELTEEGLKNWEGIVKEFEGLDKYLAQELNKENLQKLKALLGGAAAKPRLISIAPLRISYFAAEYLKEFSSLNELLKEGVAEFLKEQKVMAEGAQKQDLIKRLQKRISRMKKSLISEKAIEEYRICGELLYANIGKIKKGLEEIRLFNPYEQKECLVKLDPTKNPHENAQAYFRKYKKLKRGMPKIIEKIKALEKEVQNLVVTPLKPTSITAPFKLQQERPKPFREFLLASGSVVYVGKNAKSNADLTFRFSRPNDYFFHVRGYKGAHVILKPNPQLVRDKSGKSKIEKKKPGKKDIETAAAIAAYFSKAKTQKNVPVSYTQCKYLKKNRKGPPGSVLLMREEVIFSNPCLPEN